MARDHPRRALSRFLCGYPDANVRLLLDGEATKAAILGELDRLAASTTEHSTVFIYFSGHGGSAMHGPHDTCYLIPVDGRSGAQEVLAETAISGRELSARLSRVTRIAGGVAERVGESASVARR